MNEGDLIHAEYILKKEIGRGSYGDVWLAEKQMGLGGGKVLYALKFLRNKDEKGVDIEKVIKEIATWTKASRHLNIISIHDSFINHGKYVIVSDYADRGSLKDKTFSFEEATKIIEGVLNGLEHLHSLSVIHRDIKPDNILLKNGVACISDFGLARDLDTTQSTALGGTQDYYSPDLAKAFLTKKRSDKTELARTSHEDLWATVVTFYQLITNDLPFGSLNDTINCQRETLPRNFPTELIEFFDKAFHSNRKERFQSAKEMREALQKAVSLEAKHLAELEQLKLQTYLEKADLERKLEEAKSNTNELNRTLAEERAKSQSLAEEKQALEKKSANESLEVEQIEEWQKIEGEKLGEEERQNEESERRHLEQIIKDSTKTIELYPNDADAYLDRGHAYFDKGDYDQAFKDFDQACELESFFISAFPLEYNVRGYTKAIELNPDKAESYFNRGAFYDFLGNYKQAIADYGRALEIDPNFNDAKEKLKRIIEKKQLQIEENRVKIESLSAKIEIEKEQQRKRKKAQAIIQAEKPIRNEVVRLVAQKVEVKRKATKKVVTRVIIGVLVVIILGGLFWIVSSNLPSNVATNKATNTVLTNSSNQDTFKNSIGIEFVKIPSGSFQMGSNTNNDEKPVHQVTISNSFYMGKFEVTQAQWKAIIGNNPSYFKNCDNCPVEQVSWEDVQEFLKKLNEMGEGIYRLPTEAEWEYAARAGTTGDYYAEVDKIGWFNKNSGNKTHEVEAKQANGYGLYDTSGNVWEWCSDWYGAYPSESVTDPKGATSGSLRVLRGGGWASDAYYLHSSVRGNNTPSVRNGFIGFRLVRN